MTEKNPYDFKHTCPSCGTEYKCGCNTCKNPDGFPSKFTMHEDGWLDREVDELCAFTGKSDLTEATKEMGRLYDLKKSLDSIRET